MLNCAALRTTATVANGTFLQFLKLSEMQRPYGTITLPGLANGSAFTTKRRA